MTELFTLHHGKSEEVLRDYPDNYFDSVVCDPPYHLTSIVKRFGGANAAPAQLGTDGAFSRASKGFMGKEWDGGDIAFRPEFWAEIYRVLKPGGHLLAFSGSRTYHRMAVGIEDAGFEIRDQIMWLYGSGFPKSHDVSKGIDRAAGAEREITGVTVRPEGNSFAEGASGFAKGETLLRDKPATDTAKQWQGWGSALKPAHEPICVARKPLMGTIAENVLSHGTGALNIDGCRVGVSDTDDIYAKNPNTKGGFGHGDAAIYGESYGAPAYDPSKGRWPANVIHDGSDEVVSDFPAENGASSSRFFYCAKASKEDRDEGLGGFEEKQAAGLPMRSAGGERGGVDGDGSQTDRLTERKNTHPTVKPTDLMRYLCRMVTPPNGVVLDPFMGSGSTGKAAMLEGFRFVGIDMTEEYITIARARIQHAHDQRNNLEALIAKESAFTPQMSLFDALTTAEVPQSGE